LSERLTDRDRSLGHDRTIVCSVETAGKWLADAAMMLALSLSERTQFAGDSSDADT